MNDKCKNCPKPNATVIECLICHSKANTERISRLKELSKVDGEIFNSGRYKGCEDVAATLRSIVDPTDSRHLNIDGLCRMVMYMQTVVELAESLMNCRTIDETADQRARADALCRALDDLDEYKG
jgi:hypothetical protein